MTDTDGIFPDKITLKNAVILMKYVIKDGDKSYPQLFLEEALCDEKTQPKACRHRYKQKINVSSMSSNKMVVLVVTRRWE